MLGTNRVLPWIACAALAAGGCNPDDSDTTVVTTLITTTNGSSAGPPALTDSESPATGQASTDASTQGETGTSEGDGDSSGGGGSSSGSSSSSTSGAQDMESCNPSLLLAMTPECLVGTQIASEAWADAYCATTFGPGWIWLEHHQDWGWYVDGTWIDDQGINTRGWVHVNDQDSECFVSPYGVTWLRPEKSCRAQCWSSLGLEGPEYNPQAGQQCNAYEGDTPCNYCRSLICAKP